MFLIHLLLSLFPLSAPDQHSYLSSSRLLRGQSHQPASTPVACHSSGQSWFPVFREAAETLPTPPLCPSLLTHVMPRCLSLPLSGHSSLIPGSTELCGLRAFALTILAAWAASLTSPWPTSMYPSRSQASHVLSSEKLFFDFFFLTSWKYIYPAIISYSSLCCFFPLNTVCTYTFICVTFFF